MSVGNDEDLPILNLFASELIKQVESLKKAFDYLKEAGPKVDTVDELVRTSHSIKGAAKLINLKMIADLAGALESVFKKMSLTSFSKSFPMSNVEEGILLLEELSKQESRSIIGFTTDHAEQIEKIVHEVNSAGDQGKKGEKENLATDAKVDSIEIEGSSKIAELMKKLSEESEKLNTSLKEIDQDFANNDTLEKLIDITKRMKGLVDKVGFSIFVQLCEALESCFEAAFEDQLVWTQGHMDLILEASDFIHRVCSIESGEVEGWLSKYERNIESIACVLLAISREASSVPLSDKVEVRKESPQPKSEETIQSPSENQDVEVEEESPSDGEDIMSDLFQSELEQRVKELNNGLLELENNPSDDATIESLMRASHSLKGAARIVELSSIARLAHVMEDYFLALQKNEITLGEEDIDQLFVVVDLLTRMSQVSNQFTNTWISNNRGEIENAIKAISLLAEGRYEDQSPTQEQQSHQHDRKEKEKLQHHKPPKRVLDTGERKKTGAPEEGKKKIHLKRNDPYLRVSSSSLNRLMGLAGESLVESRWLTPFNESLLNLKRLHNSLSNDLNKLIEALQQRSETVEIDSVLHSLKQGVNECRAHVSERVNDLELFMQRYSSLSDRLYTEVINSRMRPISDCIESFPRMVRDIGKQLKKKVKLEIKGSNTPVDREILEKLEAPLTHLLRNAVDHGIELPEERREAGKEEEGTVTIEASHMAGMLSIAVSDDGRGVDIEEMRKKVIEKGFVNSTVAEKLNDSELLEFMFLPGFSSSKEVTEISGRGIGLNVVQTMVHEVGGSIKVSSNHGLTIHLQLPLTLSVIRALMVEISGEPYALPLAHVSQVINLSQSNVQHVENRQYFHHEDTNVGLVSAYQCLELPSPKETPSPLPVIILNDHMNNYGIVVDRFIGEKELVVQELDPMLGKVSDIYGGALMEDGTPVLIIDVEDMVRSIDKMLSKEALKQLDFSEGHHQAVTRKKVLVVDDSVTVREVQCRLLQNEGYDVDTAINGMDGWNAVRLGHYDLVITDIDMPRMNGIEFVKAIKNDPKYQKTPVMIVSYKEREEDRVQGLEAGANYYLTKSSFHDETLVEAVKDLIGEKNEDRNR